MTAGVLPSRVDAGADHGPNHHRALRLPAKHVAQFGALVEDLVHAAAEEVDEHQLGDRSQPGRRRADRRADETRFGDWGVEHAPSTELLHEPLRYAHHAAPGVFVDEVVDL